ncbi:hypothetical protein [Actinospongicola halichondriae]|uniref:hypothetical protein n=1 Tax=Actinospongicola halichondriae TaxID=3236844 RepID=UPI003D4A2FD4
MEKLAIMRWRRGDDAPDTDALLTAADRICRAGHWATAYVEHTGDAAAFRYGDDPDGFVLSSGLTVWVDRHEQVTEICDQLPATARTTPYLLTESVPLEWTARDWVDGIRSPGIALLTAFPKIDSIDHETFWRRWHGSHSELTFEIHPVKRYIRNVVTRALGDGPTADAIVTEVFAADDLLDPSRFYGVGEPALPWQDAMAKINEDLVTFADMDRLQTAPTEEILLHSAPWER